MKLKNLLDMYDNWNGTIVVNDDNLNLVTKARTWDVAHNKRLCRCKVLTFGFYDDEFCVRIRSCNVL